MATPAENISIVNTYLDANAKVRARLPAPQTAYDAMELQSRAQALYHAINAMKQLVGTARDNEVVRRAFAEASVFEHTLIADAPYLAQQLAGTDEQPGVIVRMADSEGRSLRQIMLDGIFAAGDGGFFDAKDPSGVTSWLHSVSVSAAGILSVIQADPIAPVVLIALKIFGEIAVPVFWEELAVSSQSFEALEARLPVTLWANNVAADLATRTVIRARLNSARDRVFSDRARQLAAPTFPIGDGSLVPTVAGPKRSWFKRGEVWSGVVLGTLGGAAVAHTRRAKL